MVLFYILGLSLTDYSFRLSVYQNITPVLSLRNKISLNCQLLANCAFTVEIIMRLFSREQFFTNPWKILHLIGTIAW